VPGEAIEIDTVFKLQGTCLLKHEVVPAIAERHVHPATPPVTLTADLLPTVEEHEWWRWLNSLSWRRSLE
jgi:hypothetical protein